MSFINPAQSAALQRFGKLLRRDGFAVHLRAASSEVPYDVLLLALNAEGEATHWQLELSFLPGLEGQLRGASLLQCFVALPVEMKDETRVDLARLLHKINARLPLIGFGYLEPERMLCFRHVLLLPDIDAACETLVVQTTWLISYLLSVFAGSVFAVARGDVTFDAAFSDHQFRDIFH